MEVFHIENGVLLKVSDDHGFINKDIKIPQDVSVIAQGCFRGLQVCDVKLPDSLIEIQDEAFYNCWNIHTIIPSSVKTIGNRVFSACGFTTLCFENNNRVERLGDGVFEGCKKLECIELPNSIREIGSSLFYGCEKLDSVKLPNQITCIPTNCFAICQSLNTISIPKSVTKIESKAFAFCCNLQCIVYEGTVDEWEKIEKAKDWMFDSKLLHKIKCKDGTMEFSKEK